MKPYITKKQYDQLFRIAPNYARLLRKGIMPKGDHLASVSPFEQLDISVATTCIVGETYNFTDNYAYIGEPDYCEACDDFSVNFNIYDSPYIDFKTEINKFLKHFKENHEDRMLYRE